MVEIWARKRQQLVGLPGLMLKGEPTSSFNEVSRAMRIHLKIASSWIWPRKSSGQWTTWRQQLVSLAAVPARGQVLGHWTTPLAAFFQR